MNDLKERTSKAIERQESKSTITNIVKSLKKCISLSIDTDNYIYSITESKKKIQIGSYVLNLRISSKIDSECCKYLVFVINRDDKTGMIHAFILDGDNYAPSVLFSTTDKYPVNKLERYIPSIIASTQTMIK